MNHNLVKVELTLNINRLMILKDVVLLLEVTLDVDDKCLRNIKEERAMNCRSKDCASPLFYPLALPLNRPLQYPIIPPPELLHVLIIASWTVVQVLDNLFAVFDVWVAFEVLN